MFYNTWVKHVKQVVPPSRLLVFEAKQGWEPLCKFLDLPVPEGKFPHVNDTPSMLKKFSRLRLVSHLIVWGIPIIFGILFAYIIFF